MSASLPEHLPELMAILAHDMRNPLSALLTNIHFVQSVARGSTLEVDEALSDSALSCTILSPARRSSSEGCRYAAVVAGD